VKKKMERRSQTERGIPRKQKIKMIRQMKKNQTRLVSFRIRTISSKSIKMSILQISYSG
jgi:hypothetical protein